jgi:hypothetical protein
LFGQTGFCRSTSQQVRKENQEWNQTPHAGSAWRNPRVCQREFSSRNCARHNWHSRIPDRR